MKNVLNMSPESIYDNLKEIAGKLEIEVVEHRLVATGVKAKSGLCKVKEKKIFIMDKNLPTKNKIAILGDCLSKFSLDEIYIAPAVRKILDNNL